MTSTYKRVGLFLLIYVLAFALFKFRAHAQTEPATPAIHAQAAEPATAPAAATAPTPTKASEATPGTAIAVTPAEPEQKAPIAKKVAKKAAAAKKPAPKVIQRRGVRRMFAEFDTSMGKFKATLYLTMMPRTVENFVGLAEGTKSWTDPRTKEVKRKPFYDGLTFHRIIKGFMIQGGDPLGDGTGGPGYKFDDEYHPNVNHDKNGILSMANAGPNTSGSQFFITLAPQPGLDKKPYHYNAFGEIVEGFDVVKKIGDVKTDRMNDRPLEPVVINSIKIIREY